MDDLLKRWDKYLVVHHWDSDGICSAAQIYEELCSNGAIIDLYTPVIGSYSLSKKEIERFMDESYDCVIVADISLPRENILDLRRLTDRLFVFDHHFQERLPGIRMINPILDGITSYPSTSWVIKDFFDRKIDLLAVLGAVGDHEERIKSFQVFREINEFLREIGLTLDDAIRMVELIDSNYRVNDRIGVKKAVFKLLKYKNSPENIMKDEEWIKKADRIRKEINRWLEAPINVIDDKIIFKEIKSSFNIISIVARRVSWDNPGTITIIVNRGFSCGSQIYVRENGLDVDLTEIIKRARAKKYISGGRRNVVGVILPNNHVKEFLGEIKDFLRRSV